MISPDDALQAVLSAVSPLGGHPVDVFSAAGRVAAADVESRRDLPPADNSAMDGFAVRARDVETTPATLAITGTVAAGEEPAGLRVEPGTAARIMTGAFIPAGADAVVEYEVTHEDEKGSIIIREPRAKGANIRLAGEDIRIGEFIPVAGRRLGPFEISRLIAAGVLSVPVHRKPRVAVLSSGNELADPQRLEDARKTPDSNAFAAMEMLRTIGCEPSYLGIARDEEASVAKMIARTAGYDAVVASAGVSEGDFDVMKKAAAAIGISWMVKDIAQKPGKPFGFGRVNGVPLFALPGNPVSASFCLYYYVMPAMKKMAGRHDFGHRPVSAVLGAPAPAHPSRTRFDRARLSFIDGTYRATPHARQGSHVITSLLEADAFIEIPPGKTVPAGANVRVFPFAGMFG